MTMSNLVLIVYWHSHREVSTIWFGACLTTVFVNLSDRFNILEKKDIHLFSCLFYHLQLRSNSLTFSICSSDLWKNVSKMLLSHQNLSLCACWVILWIGQIIEISMIQCLNRQCHCLQLDMDSVVICKATGMCSIKC